jgi:tetratricopeptide (TPR) repeat protein
MKHSSRKIVITAGLALMLSLLSGLAQDTANGVNAAQRGSGGRGGGNGGHNGGAGAQGGRAQRGAAQHGGPGNQGPGNQGPGNRGGGNRGGGMHAPVVGGSRPHGGNGNGVRNNGGGVHSVQRPAGNRLPSFSHPNPGGFRQGINRRPAQVNRGDGVRGRDNRQRSSGGLAGSNSGPRNHELSESSRVRNRNNQPFANYPSGIRNREYNGNSLNFNNPRVNIGNNNYRPSYYRHTGYHGYWNGNRGYGIGSGIGYGQSANSGYGWGYGNGYGYGGRYRRNNGYGYRPLGWGLGGWGLGSLIYNSGYLGYSNPYYTSGGWSGYNYSQPVTVSYNSPVTVIDNSVDTASAASSSDQVFSSAVAAFQQNDYDAALDITNKGITQFPDDAVLHEFRSLVLFAKQDYQQSAATIHSVLAVGPGWDWTTLIGMYSDASLYTTQLRTLEGFTKSNPDDAATHFLLAYHYLSCGHADAAARHLQQVVTLMPGDHVAAGMLKMVAKPTAEEMADAPLTDESEAARADGPPVDPATLVGAWHATRDDGSAFSLTLTDQHEFTWSFTQKGQSAQDFGGTYSIEGNVLALERKDGGSLIAEITSADASKFNFKMLGAADDDQGLNFSR